VSHAPATINKYTFQSQVLGVIHFRFKNVSHVTLLRLEHLHSTSFENCPSGYLVSLSEKHLCIMATNFRPVLTEPRQRSRPRRPERGPARASIHHHHRVRRGDRRHRHSCWSPRLFQPHWLLLAGIRHRLSQAQCRTGEAMGLAAVCRGVIERLQAKYGLKTGVVRTVFDQAAK
jgi:hypothetical protein